MSVWPIFGVGARGQEEVDKEVAVREGQALSETWEQASKVGRQAEGGSAVREIKAGDVRLG